MIRSGVCALLLAAAWAQYPWGSHEAPAESLSSAAVAEKDDPAGTLAEMRHRGLLPAEAREWGVSELAFLKRMRKAEERGGLELLKTRYLGLKGLAVREGAAGRWRLTRRGFETYLRLRSQEALDYFQARDIGAKWALQLRDLENRRLFDRGSGRLTEAGEELYSRAQLGLPVFWRLRTGEVSGNRPVPSELRAP